MTMILSRKLLAASCLTLTTACLGPNPWLDAGEETGDESGESETGMAVLGDGVWWCVTAQATVTATYADDSSQEIEEEPTGGSPTWCECAPAALDDFLDELPPAGFDAMILASDDVNYEGEGIRPLEFRQLIWDGFLLHCDALAAVQAENHESNNCGSNDVIDKTEPTLTPFSPRADCTVGEVYGNGEGMIPPPPDHWSDYFALNSVAFESGGTYYINYAFFHSLIDTPEWLIEDGAYIGHNGTDYQLYNVTSGSVAHALGLQTGDIPQTLNEIDISSVEGVMEAWSTLQSETEFELIVLRGSTPVTLDYFVFST